MGGGFTEGRENGGLHLKHRMRTEHGNAGPDRAATAQALASPQDSGSAAPPKLPSTWTKPSHSRPPPDGTTEQSRPRELVTSKSVSELEADSKKPFVGHEDAVRKKLLFRAGDSLAKTEPRGRGNLPVASSREQAETRLPLPGKGHAERRAKPAQTPVIQKARLSMQHSQSVAKMKQLKPIALNQISIAKPAREDEINCDSGPSQAAEDLFRETASFNNPQRRGSRGHSKSSRGSAFDSFYVPDPGRFDQAGNSQGGFGDLSVQKQKSSPPPISSAFASPSPRAIPLAHRTFAIAEQDPADPQQSLLNTIEQSCPQETSFDSSCVRQRSLSELLNRGPAQPQQDAEESPLPLASRL